MPQNTSTQRALYCVCNGCASLLATDHHTMIVQQSSRHTHLEWQTKVNKPATTTTAKAYHENFKPTVIIGSPWVAECRACPRNPKHLRLCAARLPLLLFLVLLAHSLLRQVLCRSSEQKLLPGLCMDQLFRTRRYEMSWLLCLGMRRFSFGHQLLTPFPVLLAGCSESSSLAKAPLVV